MGAAKDMWLEEIEVICGDFCNDLVPREEAVARLVRLGFSRDEAEIMLDEAAA